MKKLISTRYSEGAFNFAILLMRLFFGILLMNHGYDKLIHYSEHHDKFMNFLGMGSTVSYTLVVFAEFFCSLFVVLGLFTRLACIPIVINMGVALIKAHEGKVFSEGEMSALFLGAFLTLLIIGPGKISVDGMTGK
jgi:putative oxidoreductase